MVPRIMYMNPEQKPDLLLVQQNPNYYLSEQKSFSNTQPIDMFSQENEALLTSYCAKFTTQQNQKLFCDQAMAKYVPTAKVVDFDFLDCLNSIQCSEVIDKAIFQVTLVKVLNPSQFQVKQFGVSDQKTESLSDLPSSDFMVVDEMAEVYANKQIQGARYRPVPQLIPLMGAMQLESHIAQFAALKCFQELDGQFTQEANAARVALQKCLTDNQGKTVAQFIKDFPKDFAKAAPAFKHVVKCIQQIQLDKTKPQVNIQRYEEGSKLIPQGAHGCLQNHVFVRTGELSSMTETQLKKYVGDLGGSVGSAVNKSTTFVISGDKPGDTKLDAARKNKIRIISEADFFEIVQDASTELLGTGYALVPFQPCNACKAIKELEKAQNEVQKPDTSKPKKEIPTDLNIPAPDLDLKNQVPKGPKGALKNVRVCRTGELKTMTEKQLVEWIHFHGGEFDKSVTGSTTHVVVGEDPGATKLEAAKKKGVPLLSEKELFQIVIAKGGEWVTYKGSVSGW